MFIQKRGEYILEKIRQRTMVVEFLEPENEIIDENIEFDEEQTEIIIDEIA